MVYPPTIFNMEKYKKRFSVEEVREILNKYMGVKNTRIVSLTDHGGLCWAGVDMLVYDDPTADLDNENIFHEHSLDKTKIDWKSKSHTHFSMIKKGCFPKGTSREEVRKQVDGTFGGRFTHWDENSCEFEFIAYTD